MDQERFALLVQPFMVLERQLHARRRVPHYDRRSQVALVVMLAPMVVALGVSLMGVGLPAFFGSWTWLGAIPGLVWLLHSLYTDVERYVERVGIIELAEALRPLSPTSREINEVRLVLAEREMAVAAYVRTERLMAAIGA